MDTHSRLIDLEVRGLAFISGLALHQGRTEAAEYIIEDCVTVCIADTDTRAKWRNTAKVDIRPPTSIEYAQGKS